MARLAGTHYIDLWVMAVRTILHYPHPLLREPGRKVEAFTDEIRQLIDDMAETMYAAPGVGLAATQIGELWQIFVVDCAAEGEPSDLRVFVNPEIVSVEVEITTLREVTNGPLPGLDVICSDPPSRALQRASIASRSQLPAKIASRGRSCFSPGLSRS